MQVSKTIARLYKKNTMWTNVILLMFTVILARCVLNGLTPAREGFLHSDRYAIEEGLAVFDDFYAGYYDKLAFNNSKNVFEMEEITTLTDLSRHSKVLDIGSGTGHHVALLAEHGIPVVGMDSSKAMVAYAERTYPGLNFELGSALDSGAYPAGSFTHILCLQFTLYYMKDKERFFRNCMRWLMPGGYLAIHLVDRKRFNPVMPNGMADFSQRHAEAGRYSKTIIRLKDYDYVSNFLQDQNEPDVYLLREKFTDRAGNVRENEHTMHMNTQKHILGLAKREGFILLGQIDMSPIQYNYQYVYILQKPN